MTSSSSPSSVSEDSSRGPSSIVLRIPSNGVRPRSSLSSILHLGAYERWM